MILRPDQVKFVDSVVDSMRRGHKGPVGVCPTGFGKTVCGIELARRSIEKGFRVAWISHREELCVQTIETAHRSGVSVGAIGATLSQFANPTAPLQVCMVQTLLRRGQQVSSQLGILDEAHLLTAPNFGRIAGAFPYRIGLTATPCRGDGGGLEGLFDDIVLGPSMADLVAAGLLVPCEIVSVPRPLGPGEIAQHPLDAYLQFCSNRKTLVFAPHVEAAEQYLEAFKAAGVPAALVTGESTNDHRRRSLLDLKSGRLQVLVNVGVLTTGFDEPSASAAILARGFGHAGLYLQVIGRILRPHPSKTSALVVDLRGSCHVHGPPDAPRTYSLSGEAIRTAAPTIYRFCPVCSTPIAMDATDCAACGWVSEPVPLPTVVNVKLEKFAAKRQETPHARAATLARWMRQAREKKYKPGWYFARYSAVYGGSPPPDVLQLARGMLGD